MSTALEGQDIINTNTYNVQLLALTVLRAEAAARVSSPAFAPLFPLSLQRKKGFLVVQQLIAPISSSRRTEDLESAFIGE